MLLLAITRCSKKQNDYSNPDQSEILSVGVLAIETNAYA